MRRNAAIFAIVACIHFTAGLAVVYLTPLVVASESAVEDGPTLEFRMLTWATRIIHFPFISQSLYSRRWFPGNWVMVPMAADSLLWAASFTAVIWLFRRIKRG